MIDVSEQFWGARVEELQQGFVYVNSSDSYRCLVCGADFESGVVYPHDGKYYEALRYARVHLEVAHGGMLDYLLGLGKKWTGLTEHQGQLVEKFAMGQSDADIVAATGASPSTIRTQRFQLREKAKQARVFLAIMGMVETRVAGNEPFVPIHRRAKMVDERYMVTDTERQKILKEFFPQGPNGPLQSLPCKEKRKLIILQSLASRFQAEQRYTEKEVNAILKAAFTDYVSLRRYLIEYGFMDRLADGSAYWLRV